VPRPRLIERLNAGLGRKLTLISAPAGFGKTTLLIKMMMRMGLPAVVNRHIPRHWLQEGLSWGWVATIWLVHISPH
jgi:transposase